MPKIAALFDLDGVLLDTESIYTQFWHEVDVQYPTGVPNFEHIIKGNTLEKILDTYFPDRSLHPAILAMLKHQEDTMRYMPFDGVIAFLEHLQRESVPCAIVTSSSRQKMEQVYADIPGFRDYFGAIITGSDVTRSKPDPEGYLKAAQALGVAPENCTVYEDSFNGLEAGRRAGCRVVALATTNPRSALEPLADRVIDSFLELILQYT